MFDQTQRFVTIVFCDSNVTVGIFSESGSNMKINIPMKSAVGIADSRNINTLCLREQGGGIGTVFDLENHRRFAHLNGMPLPYRDMYSVIPDSQV